MKFLLWGGIGVAAGFLLLIAVVMFLPKDFFTRSNSRGRGTVRLVLKNILGVFLTLAGIVLSMPLVPGPGFVLILVGLSLVDFPGRRKLLSRAIRRPFIHLKLNSFRRRLGRPAFALPKSGA